MSDRDHLADAQPTLDRIAAALDQLSAAGWPDLHAALAGYTRERRGALKRGRLPFDVARDLIRLADEAERLVGVLARKDEWPTLVSGGGNGVDAPPPDLRDVPRADPGIEVGGTTHTPPDVAPSPNAAGLAARDTPDGEHDGVVLVTA